MKPHCCSISYRSKSRVLDINFNGVLVLGRRDPEDTSEQPYTTENLKYIKDGYKPLSNPVKLLEVDFNNPQVTSFCHFLATGSCGKECTFDKFDKHKIHFCGPHHWRLTKDDSSVSVPN